MTEHKEKLLSLLEDVSGLEHKEWPERTDGFSTLHFNGKEIAHFHHFNELDLRLGKVLIKQEGLVHYSDSKNHPKRAKSSPYIELRFQNDKDILEVVRLVKLSIAKVS